MTHRIKSVKPCENSTLLVLFWNGIEKTYDMKRLYPLFPQFKVFEENEHIFNSVVVDPGGYGISWNDDLDLDAEDIWEDGIQTGRVQEMDLATELAETVVKARDMAGMTQKQLAEATGIYQADISKIERGISNPSLLTLKRLADGMGMKLKIDFVK